MKPSRHQQGMVLLSVLIMLAVASAWSTYAWRQVFWQQRMLHSQGLEQMAWHAAEAGAIQVRDHIVQHTATQTELDVRSLLLEAKDAQTLAGRPQASWQITALDDLPSPSHGDQAWRIVIASHVLDPRDDNRPMARAHLMIDITRGTAGVQVQRWQRVYSR